MNNEKFEPYFIMSIAYLEIGQLAAKGKNMTDAYQNAVAYQLYHALELFIKYAILKSNGSVDKIHDLSELFKKYYTIYTDDIYRIEHPFDFSSYEPSVLNAREKEMYEKHIEKFKPKFMDQHLRYPPDYRTGGYSYKIDENYFVRTKDKLNELHSRLNC